MAYDKIKKERTELRLQPSGVQGKQGAKVNELEYALQANGETVTPWDYPTGTVIMDGGTGDGNSSSFALTTTRVRYWMLIRLVTTVGATPTATYKIQGSVDDTAFEDAYFADSSALETFANSSFDITTATTIIKLVKLGQEYRWWRVNVSANTNVTTTIDVTYFGTP